jgi:predicted HTH domain antitoxin
MEVTACETLVVEDYRKGHLSLGAVALLLNLETTIQTGAWLANRFVPVNYSIEDLDADCCTLDKLLEGDG